MLFGSGWFNLVEQGVAFRHHVNSQPSAADGKDTQNFDRIQLCMKPTVTYTEQFPAVIAFWQNNFT